MKRSSTLRTKSAWTASPPPHLAFGFGAYLCLGAAHARLILRTLLPSCTQRVRRLVLLAAEDRVEREASYQRVAAYESLTLRLEPH